jgi:site-specific DNA-cytosine methylase
VEPLRTIDICAGGGGWAVAARGLPVRIVAAVDISRDCLTTYVHNHPGVEPILRDVCAVDWKQINERFGPFDLIVGGIPCEQISLARNHIPADEATMRAWMQVIDACLEAARILAPRWWCYEDVVGLRRFLPAGTPHQIIDAALYGPQKRKRVYVGRFPRVEPPATPNPRTLRDCLLDGPYCCPSLALKCVPVTNGVRDPGKMRLVDAGGKSQTVLSSTGRSAREGMIWDGSRRRKLSFVECALLQGFPTDYTFIGSERGAWKQAAQAIQINCGRAILQAIVAEAQSGH